MELAGRKCACSALVLLFVAWVAFADASRLAPGSELRGVVERVKDGDSVILRVADSARIEIRLSEIDAPELSQPYGRESLRALERLAKGRRVRLEVVDTDRYGRTVAEVFLEGRSLNAEMVRAGHAWAYTRYAKSTAIIELEAEARAAKRGIWTLPEREREAPWLWRAARRDPRAGRAEPPLPPTSAGPEGCGAKRFCREMTSCVEAKFHLEQCGRSSLDGDADGVPCESLCEGG